MLMVLAIVQARVCSTRLPHKVMKKVLGKPLIGYLLERLSLSKKIDKILVAIPESQNNNELCDYVVTRGFKVFRGNEEDVLDRYYRAAMPFQPHAIVRITADCPLNDYQVIDSAIDYYLTHRFDCVSNRLPPTYPNGIDVEIFSFSALEMAWRNATLKSDREHVFPYMLKAKQLCVGNLESDIDLSHERWTVDEPEDFILVKTIIENLYKKHAYFGLHDILAFKEKNPDVFRVNQHIKRDMGYLKNLNHES